MCTRWNDGLTQLIRKDPSFTGRPFCLQLWQRSFSAKEFNIHVGMDFPPALQYILWYNQISVEYSIDFAIFACSSISKHQFAVLNNLQNLLNFRDNKTVNNSPCLERFIHYNVCQDPHKKTKLLEDSWRQQVHTASKTRKKEHPGWQLLSNMIIMLCYGIKMLFLLLKMVENMVTISWSCHDSCRSCHHGMIMAWW